MRERLASGRARSDMLLAGAEAFGDPLGALLCRGLDNGHWPSLKKAQTVLARNVVSRRCDGQASRAAQYVLLRLADQRCNGCKGLKHVVSESGVYTACLPCNATGITGDRPHWWSKIHQLILIDALTAIGRHLARTRAQVVES